MASIYPADIDGYSQIRVVRDGIDEIVARDHNDERSAIIAIEQTLGINPQGAHGTVANRLDSAATNIEDHVMGYPPRHQDTVIESAGRSGTYHSLTVGTVGSQITELLEDINHILYPGSAPHTFADGYALPSSNLRGAVTRIVDKVGNSGGAGRIGATPFTEGQFSVTGSNIQDQVESVAKHVDEGATIRQRIFDTFVSEGCGVIQGSGVNATVQPGVIISNGRIARMTVPQNVTVPTTPGTYYIYAKSVNGTVTLGAGTPAQATSDAETTTVLLHAITHDGAITWTWDQDIRRYGMLENNRHSFVVADPNLIPDGYGYDFTTIQGAIDHLKVLKLGKEKGAPIKIVLASDMTISSTIIVDNDPSETGNFIFDGGGHTITTTADSPIFTLEGVGIEIRNTYAASSVPSATDVGFAAIGSIGTTENVIISNCTFKSTGSGGAPPHFISCGGTASSQYVDRLIVDRCTAFYKESAITWGLGMDPPLNNHLENSTISNNVFVQVAPGSTDSPASMYIGSGCVVKNNYVEHARCATSGAGIVAIDASDTNISENIVVGNNGATPNMTLGIGVYSFFSLNFNCKISGNIVKGISSVGFGVGIAVELVPGTVVSNNVVSNLNISASSIYGILSVGSSGSIVEGNFVLNAGVGISAPYVVGNYIDGTDAGAPIAETGIELPLEGIAIGNWVYGVDGNGIRGSSDCFVANNYLIAGGIGSGATSSAFYNFAGRSQIIGNFAIGYGVAGFNGSGVLVSNVQASLSIIGNYFYECIGDILAMQAATDCLISSNYIFGAADSLIAVKWAGDRTLIEGNMIVGMPDTSGTAIWVSGSSCAVSSNGIINCSGTGIYLEQQEDCLCVGNILAGAGGTLKAIWGIGDKTLVSGNYISDYSSSYNSTTIESASGASDVSIVGNMIENCGGMGINANAGERVLISSNHLSGNANSTSGISYPNQDSIVSNNIISNYGQYAGTNWGIRSSSSSGKLLIIGNLIHECGANLTKGIILAQDVYYHVIGNIVGDQWSAPTASGIDLGSSTRSVVLDNIVAGEQSGVAWDSGIIGIGDKCFISGNYITNANYNGIDVAGLYVVCTNNYIVEPYQDGVNVGTKMGYFHISNNYIDEPGNNGVTLQALAQQGMINNNFIIDAGTYGIQCESSGAGTTLTLVNDNYISSPTTDGIHMEDSTNCNIVGNYVFEAGDDGVQLYSCTDMNVIGNFLYYCNYGFYITGTSSFCNVNGNYIAETQAGSTLAIYAESSLVSSNYCLNSASAGIYASGQFNNIVGNFIYTPSTDGINIGSSSSYNNVVGNLINDPGNDGIESSSGFLSIANNMIYSPSSEGIYVTGGYSSINGNCIRSPGTDGIWFGSSNMVVSGNAIWSPGGDGIDASNAGAGADSTVSGNYMTNVFYGIRWNSTGHRAVISSNFINNVDDTGIAMAGADDCVVSSNVVASFDWKAFHVGGCDGAVVIGNKSYDSQDPSSYGMDYWGITNSVIIGNMMEGNTAGFVGGGTTSYLLIGNLSDGASGGFTAPPLGTTFSQCRRTA